MKKLICLRSALAKQRNERARMKRFHFYKRRSKGAQSFFHITSIAASDRAHAIAQFLDGHYSDVFDWSMYICTGLTRSTGAALDLPLSIRNRMATGRKVRMGYMYKWVIKDSNQLAKINS